MNTVAHQAPAGGVNTRQRWAAVAVLGITVIALGASLVHIQTRPVDGHAVLADFDPTELTLQPASANPVPVTAVGPGESPLAKPAVPAKRAKPARAQTITAPDGAVSLALPPPVQQEPEPTPAATSAEAITPAVPNPDGAPASVTPAQAKVDSTERN